MKKLMLIPVLKYTRKLKYPTLFKLFLGLFVVSVFLPDPIPFVDEIILGLGTLLISRWKEVRPGSGAMKASALPQ